MNDFLTRFEEYCIQEKLLRPRDKVLVAFSGGADSTALLTALVALRPKLELEILVAHVNYHLRGEESDTDEQYVRDFCFSRNLGLVVKSAPLSGESRIEERARKIRFDYFRALQTTYRFDAIALGHHRDDQAETVLLRLFRGAGATGLRGILPRNGIVIHPLLPFSREDIREFLRERNLEWREDTTNSETRQTRNLIRHELLPWVKAKFNPHVAETLAETAGLIADIDEILREQSRLRLNRMLIEETEAGFVLPLKDLRNLKPTLRFYLFREVIRRLTGSEADFYAQHCAGLENLLGLSGSKSMNLPGGITASKDYDTLLIALPQPAETADDRSERVLSDLRSSFQFGGHRFAMKKVKQLPNNPFEDRHSVWLDFDQVKFPLVFRYRHPGDRFRPFGMEGEKKLKAFFIDEKIPRENRDRIVILCDQERILWVCGYRINQSVAVTADTRQILSVKAEPIHSGRARSAERMKTNEMEGL
jgi:tRNA(Ile)-lysidine synthase